MDRKILMKNKEHMVTVEAITKELSSKVAELFNFMKIMQDSRPKALGYSWEGGGSPEDAGWKMHLAEACLYLYYSSVIKR